MTTSEASPIALAGCAPTPLAGYLKALGVLRLISSAANNVTGAAADPKARGWWDNECFHLQTTLDRDALTRFFLEEYAPSPVIAPWNGGSGFYPGDNTSGIGPLSSDSVATRFVLMAQAVAVASAEIRRRGLTQRPENADKVSLVASLRASLPDTALDWLDAALALGGDDLSYPQLLGTGGNDGRLDFTNNFMQRLVADGGGLFDAGVGDATAVATPLLSNALFADVSRDFASKKAIGQFSPGATGGPNATSGFDADSSLNPWDFVLMIEGAIAFAGAATRRHQGASEAGASFPFTVRPVGAGRGDLGETDENDARAEFWAPIWSRPSRFTELDTLFVEGRAVLNGRTARDGLAFARAASSLGVSRGFSAFERYGFVMRSGKAYLATPLGRRAVARKPTMGAMLVAELDANGWLERVRRVTREKTAPTAARNAVRRLEDALFDLVDDAAAAREVGEAIISLGRLAAAVSLGKDARDKVAPPPCLSRAWEGELTKGSGGSAEVRVAAALASLGWAPAEPKEAVAEDANDAAPAADNAEPSLPRHHAPPMAAHLAPIDEASVARRRRRWVEGDPRTVVWGAGDLVSNMIAVLERRLVEASMRGLDDKPFAGASPARASDVAAFLSGGFDDALCAALLRGLVWARPAALLAGERKTSGLPFAYAALKPVFSPDADLRAMEMIAPAARMPVPPGMVAGLRAGGTDGRAIDAAVRAAIARARGSGLASPFDPARAGGRSDRAAGGRIGAGVDARRLAAALLIPISQQTLKSIAARAYDLPEKDADHAA